MKRVQRQRTKGWRMPEGAVYVGRPTQWGNPWRVSDPAMPWIAVLLGLYGNRAGCTEAAVKVHRAWMTDALPLKAPGVGIATAFAANAAAMYLADSDWPEKPDLAPLRGHDLVCWCPLDQPCHADVLLELAN
jgi:hypothetical protein